MSPTIIGKGQTGKFVRTGVAWHEMTMQVTGAIAEESIIEPICLECAFCCFSHLIEYLYEFLLFRFSSIRQVKHVLSLTPYDASPEISLVLVYIHQPMRVVLDQKF